MKCLYSLIDSKATSVSLKFICWIINYICHSTTITHLIHEVNDNNNNKIDEKLSRPIPKELIAYLTLNYETPIFVIPAKAGIQYLYTAFDNNLSLS